MSVEDPLAEGAEDPLAEGAGAEPICQTALVPGARAVRDEENMSISNYPPKFAGGLRALEET